MHPQKLVAFGGAYYYVKKSITYLFKQFPYIIFIFSRSHAVYLFKCTVEGALAGKARTTAYVGYAVVCAAYQARCVFCAYQREIVAKVYFNFV